MGVLEDYVEAKVYGGHGIPGYQATKLATFSSTGMEVNVGTRFAQCSSH